MTFSDLVETVKYLSIEGKEELQMLLKQYLREERREEIYENVKLARNEEQQAQLKFSVDINELKRSVATYDFTK
jgi:flagellar motor switch protein FliG